MASTRNRNTMNDYILEKKENKRQLEYIQFQNASYGKAYNTNINCIGSVPSLSRECLSRNPVETESFLFGINSTNLEVHKLPFVKQPVYPDFKPFFERQNQVQMPHPLYIDNNQRVNFRT